MCFITAHLDEIIPYANITLARELQEDFSHRSYGMFEGFPQPSCSIAIKTACHECVNHHQGHANHFMSSASCL